LKKGDNRVASTLIQKTNKKGKEKNMLVNTTTNRRKDKCSYSTKN